MPRLSLSLDVRGSGLGCHANRRSHFRNGVRHGQKGSLRGAARRQPADMGCSGGALLDSGRSALLLAFLSRISPPPCQQGRLIWQGAPRHANRVHLSHLAWSAHTCRSGWPARSVLRRAYRLKKGTQSRNQTGLRSDRDPCATDVHKISNSKKFQKFQNWKTGILRK